jgi:hypothetical protein
MSQAYADFGELVVETDVDDAVIATLKMWLPTYMTQLELERGLDYRLARPRQESYANAIGDDEFLDHALPAVIVTTAQTDGMPDIMSDGSHIASWSVRVSCIVRGPTAAQTRYNASLTSGSVRRALVQHSSLDGAVHTLRWKASRITPWREKSAAGRFLVIGATDFTIWTDNAVKATLGPSAPDHDPYGPLPLVQTVTTDLTANPIPQED